MKLSIRPHERLKKRSQFRKVYKKGRSVKNIFFKLLYLENDQGYNRVGISIEKKRISSSSHRIRVKRLLRECHRLNKTRFRKNFDFDIVIIAYQKTEDLGFRKVSEELISLYKTAGLIE